MAALRRLDEFKSEWKLVNLTYDWLHTFMPYCLTKLNRVTFGLLTQADVEAQAAKEPNMSRSRISLVIPFIGKDCPSPAAEFAQPDITIGLTCLAYHLQGLRPLDINGLEQPKTKGLVDYLQEQMNLEPGSKPERPTSKLYNAWVQECGGEVCGVSGFGPQTENSSTLLNAESLVLHLDSRRPESSSGALNECMWRDLSGHCHDVDLSLEATMMAQTGGYYECGSRRLGGADNAVTPAAETGSHLQRSSSHALVDLPALKIGHTPKLQSTLEGDFTLTVVMQCISDDRAGSSHLPISLLGGALMIGVGKNQSKESIEIHHAALAPNDDPLSLPYPPGLQNTTGQTRVHQFTFGPSERTRDGHTRELKYMCDGAFIAKVSLPPLTYNANLDCNALVVGAATELTRSGAKHQFDGIIFCVLLHDVCISPHGVHELASSLMSTKSEWGEPRPGDATTDGAMMHLERTVLMLDRAVMLCDTRAVTHHMIHDSIKGVLCLTQKRNGIFRNVLSRFRPARIVELLEQHVKAVDDGKAVDLILMNQLHDALYELGEGFAAAFSEADVGKHVRVKEGSVMVDGAPRVVQWVAGEMQEDVDGIIVSVDAQVEFKVTLQGGTWFSNPLGVGVWFMNNAQREARKGRGSSRKLLLDGLPLSIPSPTSRSSSGQVTPRRGSTLNVKESNAAKMMDAQRKREVRHRQLLEHARGAIDRVRVQQSDAISQLLQRDFSCTAVLLCKKSSVWPLVLLSSIWFDGLYDGVRNLGEFARHRQAGEVLGPEAHTLTLSIHGAQHELCYYIDGELHMKRTLNLNERSPSSRLFQALVEGDLLGVVTRGATDRAHIFFWLMHQHALRQDEVEAISRILVPRTHNRSWKWGCQPSTSLLAWEWSRFIRASKITLRPEARVLQHVTKPRVQPLFKLGSDGNSATASREQLHKLLGRSQAVQKYFLTSAIFPRLLRFQTEKISASGGDLGGYLVFPKRIGFTGTPSDILPRSMGKCGFQDGTTGEMVHTLTSEAIMKTVSIRDKDWTSKMILDMIARGDQLLEQPLHALIDTGALITGMSNYRVAEYLMSNNGLPNLDGVVYLGEDDIPMIYERDIRDAIKLAHSAIPMERRFVFYDQVHTTGTGAVAHIQTQRHLPRLVLSLKAEKFLSDATLVGQISSMCQTQLLACHLAKT